MVADYSVRYNLAEFLLEQAPHNESKRALRQYYHEQLAPASDVDLFIYGLNEEQAIEKIKEIEAKVSVTASLQRWRGGSKVIERIPPTSICASGQGLCPP